MGKKIWIIGTGMDGRETLTKKAQSCIEEAEVLIGAERMLKPYEELLGKERFFSYKYSEIEEYISNTEKEKIAVLMSGDCGFYSGARLIKEALKDCETELVSGIASPVYMANAVGVTWNDMYFVSLHGKNANIARAVSEHKKTFFLLGGAFTADMVCKRLCEYKMSDVTVYIGERLATENERIYKGRAKEFTDRNFDSLSVILVINEAYERFLKCGIRDEAFIRGRVPMTKAVIRGTAVSMLNIERDGICWDLGCGTGSVSVEMALRCSEGMVYSVDKNPEAIGLTIENSHLFGCDNITVKEGEICEAIGELPAPQGVFIGGSGGRLESILAAVYEKNINAGIVITAVSIETIGECVKIFDSYKKKPEIMQLGVTNTKRVKEHTLLQAENPVFLISCTN